MKNRSFILASVAVACVLSACAGVGIVATADPLQKLNDAGVLYMQKNRPLPAETLIQEATELYRQRNDPRGMGNSFREYADLLKSPAVQAHEAIYRRDGFRDKPATA